MKSDKECECGCGQLTNVSERTQNGYKKGDPLRFLPGHNPRPKGNYQRQPPFKPVCPRCGEKNSPGRTTCLFCGCALVPGVKSEMRKKRDPRYGSHDPIVVKSEDFKKLLDPLVEMNGVNWVAEQCGTSFSRMKQILYSQEFISFGVVDRYLTNIGLYHALRDGSLTLYANPNWTQQAFENYFIRCGDPIPDDIISSWND